MDKKKVLIIGAAGALGQNLCKNLNYNKEILVYVGDYKPRRGSRVTNKWNAEDTVYVDATKEDSIYFAVNGMDCVVVALKQEEALIQRACYELNVPCIDVSAHLHFVKKIDDLSVPKKSPSIAMAGFFPGLSGILINEIKKQFDLVKQIDVYFIQNIHSNVGKSGVIDMFDIINEPLPHKKKAFTNTRDIDIEDSKYEVKQIEHGERKVLNRELDIKKLNYWTGWNKKWFTKMTSFLIQTDLLNQFIPLITSAATRKSAKDETVYLKVTARGICDIEQLDRELLVKAQADYDMTAQMVNLLLLKLLNEANTAQLSGLTFPYEWIEYKDIQPLIFE